MKLNILSDLHLTFADMPLPQNEADVVVLAGDIARPAKAMAWASRFGKPVLYVAGNHEFYGGSMPEVSEELKRLCAGTRVRVLDNDAVVIDGVRFLGTTLWTDFLLYPQRARRKAALDEAMHLMYDFKKIRSGDGQHLFTPEDSASLFQANATWLAARFAEPHDGPTVVITHHAPSPRSIHPRFADSLLNPCFISDAESLVEASGAALWIHGHTHDSFDYAIAGTRVVCNSRGYWLEGRNENARFDADFVVEIGT